VPFWPVCGAFFLGGLASPTDPVLFDEFFGSSKQCHRLARRARAPRRLRITRRDNKRLVESKPRRRRMIAGPQTTTHASTKNISLEEQRARLEAELESETDAGTISSLRGKIDVLDARKAENELVASKVPNSESYICWKATAICFWFELIIVQRCGWLTLRELRVNHARHRRGSQGSQHARWRM